MHICIPDTREVRPHHGSAYLLYNVHIDGLYHCSLRYKQLHHLHQALVKRFPSGNPEGLVMPSFPPKKLLPLTQNQVEDRRQLLEKYLQNISQDKQISQSSVFNMYLLEAQRESCSRLVDANKHVHLDIELVNGQKIRLPIVTHDSVDSVLTACCRSLGLADQYHAYFCLCLCGYDVVSDKLIIKRRLSFFEAPYITLQMATQQQEQLQSVLATSNNGLCTTPNNNNNIIIINHNQQQQQQHHNHYHNNFHDHYHHTTLNSSPSSSSSSSSITNLNNNSNSNLCRCQSCATLASAPPSTTITTGVPLVSSSATSSRAVNGARGGGGGGGFVTHRILLRKSYWDPVYDTYILSDQQALSLLFIQTVYDMKHSLMFVDRPTYHQLESLLASDSKLEYILLARTLKYYNYVHFEPCYSDYPRPRTKVMISIGSKELNMRVLKSPQQQQQQQQQQQNGNHSSSRDSDQQQAEVLYCTSSLVPYRGHKQMVTKEDLIEEEYNFKVPLIRCWRLTSLETLNSKHQLDHHHHHHSDSHSHRQPPAATTTLAGGKRKSLSLFNSVLGSASGACSGPGGGHHSSNGDHDANTTTTTGIGGPSLMATLMTHTSDNTNLNNNSSSTQQQQQQHVATNGTTTTANTSNTTTTTTNSNTNSYSNANGTLDSFFRFSSNSNQTQTPTSNNNTNGNCQQQQQQHYNENINNSNKQCVVTRGPILHHHDTNTDHAQQQQQQQQLSQYELSFEYLIAKDTLKWITISSDQAIFISISLQGVVDELVSKRDIEATYNNMGNSNGNSLHVSRPIAIQRTPNNRQPVRQLAQSFTYLYRDGAQKSIKARSQQQLIQKFCSVGGSCALGDGGLSSSAPSSSGYALAANTAPPAAQARQRNQSEATSPGGNSSSFISSPPRRSSILPQVASFWGSSPPGRYYGHQSSSGNYSSTSGGGGVAPFEFYHCNTRHAGHNSKCKAPNPIINDAFEGVVSNDDDL